MHFAWLFLMFNRWWNESCWAWRGRIGWLHILSQSIWNRHCAVWLQRPAMYSATKISKHNGGGVPFLNSREQSNKKHMEPARKRTQCRFMQRFCIQPAQNVQVREECISLNCLCFSDDASNIFKLEHRAMRFQLCSFPPNQHTGLSWRK